MRATDDDTAVETWEPDARTGLIWTAAGSLLTLVGVALFAIVASLPGGGFRFELGGGALLLGLLAIVVLSVALMALHELVHGVVMRAFGARPVYGAALAAGMPVLYCTAPGHRFSRGQYVVVALAPLVLISLAGGLATLLPFGGWLVVPLGLHLGGTIGDLWLAGLTLRRPAGTLVEDRKAGVRFYLPAGPVYE